MGQQNPPERSRPEEDYRHYRRHHHGGISAIGGGLIVMLAGLLLFLANRGVLSWDKWWQLLIIGIGAVLLADGLLRFHKGSGSEYRTGRLVTAVILIGVGIAFLVGSASWWPLVIIVAGAAVVVGGLLGKGQSRQ